MDESYMELNNQAIQNLANAITELLAVLRTLSDRLTKVENKLIVVEKEVMKFV